MTDRIELGLRIEQTRKSKGLSLENVAENIGVATSTIQRYEKGKIQKIKLPVIFAIAEFLDVNPDWLLQKSTDKSNSKTPVTVNRDEHLQDWIQVFQSLSNEGQRQASDFVHFLSKQEENQKTSADSLETD